MATDLVAIVCLAIGSYLLYRGVQKGYVLGHLLTTPPVPTRELYKQRGTAAVEGEVVADGEAVTGPFSGQECLAYTYEFKEGGTDIDDFIANTEIGKELNARQEHHRKTETGRESTSFLVEDHAGTVSVDPTDATLWISEQTMQYAPADDLPDHIEQFIEAEDRLRKPDPELGHIHHYTEKTVQNGDDIFVFGQLERLEGGRWGDNSSNHHISDGSGAPFCLISDSSRRDTVRQLFKQAAWRLVAAGILISVGVELLL